MISIGRWKLLKNKVLIWWKYHRLRCRLFVVLSTIKSFVSAKSEKELKAKPLKLC